MTSLYLEAFSGISGDMFIGALLDLGLNFDDFQRQLSKLHVSGYQLKAEQIAKSHIYGTNFDTILDVAGKDDAVVSPADQKHAHHHHHQHRHLNDIRTLIQESDLSQNVKDHAISVFTEIAKAEAHVHHMSVEDVHFHEVGALDSIIDIVGAFVALEMLNIDHVYCSEISDGSGFIHVAHGVMPVPVPAVMQMRTGTTIPIRQLPNIRTELVTPTGMGLIKEIVTEFGPIPDDFELETVGYGFGNREIPQLNALRVLKGERRSSSQAKAAGHDQVTMMEANVDDQSPETLAPIMDELLDAGALDVFFTPIQMKKNRPAVKLSVLLMPDDLAKLSELIFKLTSTIGVRYQVLNRLVMKRHFKTVETDYGPIQIKVANYYGTEKATPEFEDCLKAAKKANVAVQTVYQAVYKQL